ncbi:hypothetical protein E4T38_00296 [Aureobasidium subglaciale]|nr:hypothetical protein E4T38_00296 [Aureobasidium subglaciale]KAI5232500.1 hypothetical protein E4T40_00295 [Aureobasidium subglaciale]KAI5234659.1 hypothetical protein E4T41_00295 [Aureobasidium subglaciale]KAI5268477.1 hypothetical protein E4T46_00295 [Aureobasidium subglaciale]
MKRSSLILLCTVSLASAFDGGVYGLGYWNETYAWEANQNPNDTVSVPFQLGSQNFTMQVNIAEFTPTGRYVNRTENARQVASFYDMSWSGGVSLNDTIQSASSGFTDAAVPRLCISVPLGPLSRSATNSYRENDNGDCSHAFGSECMNDLKKVQSVTYGSCGASWMPKSCVAKFGDGGIGSTRPNRSNTTDDALRQRSPLEVSWYQSEIFSAPNETYLKREAERLHAVFFSGAFGVVPVCARVNVTKLGKTSDAVYQGEAGYTKSSMLLYATAALISVAFVL